MEILNLTSANGTETTVRIVRETAKAILVKGNASEAWFPKKAIDTDGNIAEWFRGGLAHAFLFDAPYDAQKRISAGAPL